uniref:Transmembrane protein n=1 Tax=Mesocestoides corti TaxID=53468 RepID=A0A5K3ELB0_MESCO
MKETCTTEQTLLTNHKPEPPVRRGPSESITLATPIIYVLHLIHVLLWLAANLPRMPLERRETEYWLKLVWSNMSARLYVATVEYPNPSMKETGTTKEALLTNQKPEPRVSHLPSESATLATPLIIYCSSIVSFSGWLLIFLACHWN